MQFIIVISMFFALFIALFAIQNATIITINILWYKFNMSQAVIILASALFGILIMLPFDIAKRIKHGIKINDLNNKIKRLNEELNTLKVKESSNKPVAELQSENESNAKQE